MATQKNSCFEKKFVFEIKIINQTPSSLHKDKRQMCNYNPAMTTSKKQKCSVDGTAEGAALWTFDLHMDKMFLPQSTSLEHLKRVHAALGRHIEAAEAA